jgi:hypothetical protein
MQLCRRATEAAERRDPHEGFECSKINQMLSSSRCAINCSYRIRSENKI